MKAFAMALLLCSPLALLVACEDKPVNTAQRAEPLSTPTPIADKRIIYDQQLRDIASVTGIRQATVSGNILKIQVDVTNLKTKSTSFNYKFNWYDPEGMQIDTALTTWQSQTIEGRETVTLTGIAPTPTAKDFKL